LVFAAPSEEGATFFGIRHQTPTLIGCILLKHLKKPKDPKHLLPIFPLSSNPAAISEALNYNRF